jgi:hypothetical protein
MPRPRERMRSIRELGRRDIECPAGGARRLSGANPSDVTGFTPVRGLLRCARSGSGGSMKFGVRKPSLRKSFAARTSPKRIIRHSLGLKAPRGYGWITNPKKAAYNRVYNRTTVSAWSILGTLLGALFKSGRR